MFGPLIEALCVLIVGTKGVVGGVGKACGALFFGFGAQGLPTLGVGFTMVQSLGEAGSPKNLLLPSAVEG